MKKILLSLVITVILVSCGGKKENQYVFEGAVEGVDTGMIFLQKYDSDQWVDLDSTHIKEGEFTFTGNIASPEMMKLMIKGMDYSYSFFAENSDINITIYADNSEKIEVHGSSSDEVYRRYLSKEDSIGGLMKSLYGDYDKAQKTGDTARLKELDTVFHALETSMDKIIIDFATRNNKSVICPFLLIFNAYRFELPDLEAVSNIMDSSLKASIYYRAVKERVAILKRVQVGLPAVQFSMNDTSGNPVSLSSFRGKYLLIDFWASWCGPCRRENPNVVKVYRAFNNKGFDVLGVSLDKNKERWMQAIKKDNLTWTHVSDLKHWANAASKIYGISSIPSNVLLDKDQVIIARNLRGEDLMKKLTEIIGPPYTPVKTAHKK